MPRAEPTDPQLLKFVRNDAQRRTVEAMLEHGTQAAAARALGTNSSNISNIMGRVRRYAAEQGHAPDHDMTRTAPDTHYVKGTSTYYGADGQVSGQWVKTDKRAADIAETAQLIVDSLAAEITGAAKRVAAPKHADDDLMVCVPIGDPHVGMYAWHEETGEDFDLDIAERDIDAAVTELMRSAPKAGTCVIVNLGDFFHADDQNNRTPRGGNQLDVDSRYAKVIRTGVRILAHVVDKALRRHGRVILRSEAGNHDPHSGLWLSIVLDAYFRSEPRVEVALSPAPFWYHRFGRVLIGTTHGHGPKPAALPGIMATDVPADWGESTHRAWIHGHIHSTTRHEFPGCVVESFRTLAGKDAWHTQQGYRSGRDMTAIVYHREHGEIARHRVDITRVREAQSA